MMRRMFKKIVVLLEGTDEAQPALGRAALCAGRGTEVVVLDIVHEPMLDGYLGNKAVYEPLRNRVLAERQERVAALAASLRKRGVEATGNAIWAARRDEGVEEHARTAHADLIVMTPLDGGRHGLSSSDWRLLAASPAPVLVVKGPCDRQYRNIVAAVDPFHAHAKPADLDAKILATATELKAQTGAALTVLHCFTPQRYVTPDTRIAPRDDEAAARHREALPAVLRDAGVPVSAGQVVLGAPHAVLHGMAERGEADVIIMGVLARGRIKDWLIGSTAERVLHRTRIDVLAVSPTR
jgi:universal stress protein E